MLAGTVWAFAVIAEDVFAGQHLTALDTMFARAAPVDTTPWRSIHWYLTWLGTGYVVVPVTLAVAVVLFQRGHRRAAIAWYASQAGAWWLNALLKDTFIRIRPDGWDRMLAGSDLSFPSGHAMGAVAFAGVATYLLLRLARPSPLRTLTIAAMLAWSAAMGFSRAYLGVHYASDVIAGFLAGVAWVAICVVGMEIGLRRGDGVRRHADECIDSVSAELRSSTFADE